MNSDSDDEHQERHSRLLPTGEPARSNGSLLAAIHHGGVVVEGGVAEVDTAQPAELEKVKEEPVTWASLPHRSQLIILTLARLSEPLVQTSLQVSRAPNDKRRLREMLLMVSGDRHICSTNSNPSMRAFPIPSLQHRLDLWPRHLPEPSS